MSRADVNELVLADAVVRVGPVAASLLGERDRGVLWDAVPGRFLLRVPAVARYLVEGGSAVTVDPVEGAGMADVRHFLSLTPLAALHLQRGTPVLHAAVVRPPGGSSADVLAGDSSHGKSALAAVLWLRGWSVLADGIGPLTLDAGGRPSILPTGSDLMVWPDIASRVGPRPGGRDVRAEGCGPVDQRLRLRCGPDAGPDAVPVRAIWHLGTHNLGDVGVREITGANRFQMLGSVAYNSRIASALLDRQAYFHVATSLASGGVPMKRLMRPRSTWSGDALANVVEAAHAG